MRKASDSMLCCVSSVLQAIPLNLTQIYCAWHLVVWEDGLVVLGLTASREQSLFESSSRHRALLSFLACTFSWHFFDRRGFCIYVIHLSRRECTFDVLKSKKEQHIGTEKARPRQIAPGLSGWLCWLWLPSLFFPRLVPLFWLCWLFLPVWLRLLWLWFWWLYFSFWGWSSWPKWFLSWPSRWRWLGLRLWLGFGWFRLTWTWTWTWPTQPGLCRLLDRSFYGLLVLLKTFGRLRPLRRLLWLWRPLSWRLSRRLWSWRSLHHCRHQFAIIFALLLFWGYRSLQEIADYDIKKSN